MGNLPLHRLTLLLFDQRRRLAAAGVEQICFVERLAPPAAACSHRETKQTAGGLNSRMRVPAGPLRCVHYKLGLSWESDSKLLPQTRPSTLLHALLENRLFADGEHQGRPLPFSLLHIFLHWFFIWTLLVGTPFIWFGFTRDARRRKPKTEADRPTWPDQVVLASTLMGLKKKKRQRKGATQMVIRLGSPNLKMFRDLFFKFLLRPISASRLWFPLFCWRQG